MESLLSRSSQASWRHPQANQLSRCSVEVKVRLGYSRDADGTQPKGEEDLGNGIDPALLCRQPICPTQPSLLLSSCIYLEKTKCLSLAVFVI